MKITPYNFLKDVFDSARDERGVPVTSLENSKNLDQRRENGTLMIKAFVDKSLIKKLSDKFDEIIFSGEKIFPGRNFSQLEQGKNVDVESYKRLTKQDIKKGQEWYREITDSVKILDPLINIPEILEIATNEEIVSLAASYLGGNPAITYVKCVRTFANKIPEINTQNFHLDANSTKMFKVFVCITHPIIIVSTAGADDTTDTHTANSFDIALVCFMCTLVRINTIVTSVITRHGRSGTWIPSCIFPP